MDYEDISEPKELTCADGEKKIIKITENDIKRGFMTVRSKAEEKDFTIKVSGPDFEETPITVKVDSASPAYETIKKYHIISVRTLICRKQTKSLEIIDDYLRPSS